MTRRLLFVYGTLKRGEFNDLRGYQPQPQFLGEGWVRGRLHDLGHCPTMELDETAGQVWGELFELDAGHFDALDRYEALCGDYVLEQVRVHLADQVIVASVYVSGPNQVVPDDAFIPEGRWALKQAVTACTLSKPH